MMRGKRQPVLPKEVHCIQREFVLGRGMMLELDTFARTLSALVLAGRADKWNMLGWQVIGLLHMLRYVCHVARGDPTKRWATSVQSCWTSEVDSTAWHMRCCIGARATLCTLEAEVASTAASCMATRGCA